MPRLFAGLALPSSIARSLLPLQLGLQNARWRPEENFHITLNFFGDVDTHEASDIDEALSQIHGGPFQLKLKGVGQFGNDRPRAVWAGVEEDGSLSHLASKVSVAVQRIGLPPERRKYMPHVTLAYLKRTDVSSVKEYVSTFAGYESASFPIEEFVLFQSHLGKGSSHYVPLAHYALGARHSSGEIS